MESLETPRQARPSFHCNLRTHAYQFLAVLIAVGASLALHALGELARLRAEVRATLRESERRFLSLQSRVQFDSERRRLHLGIRDAILQSRPTAGARVADELANLVLEVTEKFPGVDPLLLVAVGIVESGYDVGAISHAGARGLYQIHPPTGRFLARELGWEFDDELLHDPARNTEMAACYLNLLGDAYNDVQMILAEYNGGPLNAGYFRANAGKLAGETRDYVPRVLAVYQRLQREIGRVVPLASPGIAEHRRPRRGIGYAGDPPWAPAASGESEPSDVKLNSSFRPELPDPRRRGGRWRLERAAGGCCCSSPW